MHQLRKTLISTGLIVFAGLVVAASLLQPGMASAATTTLAPNAAGDSPQLTPYPSGSGTNYIRVQTADNDTSYVYTTSSSYQIDLYNLGDVSLSGNITSISVTMVAFEGV